MKPHDEDTNNTTVVVNFVRRKFGTDLPVIDDFLFYPKDSAHSRFHCRTRSCKASVIVKKDSDGVFHADRFLIRNHPNHNENIAALKQIQRLRAEAERTSRSRQEPADQVFTCGTHKTRVGGTWVEKLEHAPLF